MARFTLRSILPCIALAFGLAACDGAVDDLGPFPNGEPRLSDRGGFVVAISAPSLDEGDLAALDELRLDIAFPGFDDPLAGQRGIPGVDVEVNVHALGEGAGAPQPGEGLGPRALEVGDGQYRLVDLGIGSGAWSVDLDLRVGDRIEDHVEFAFEL
jgi:hypothetical protein